MTSSTLALVSIGGGGGVGCVPVNQASVAVAASVAEEGRKEAREEVIEDDQDDTAMIFGRVG